VAADKRTRADDQMRVLLVQRRMRSIHASWRAIEGSEAIPVSGPVWIATTASRLAMTMALRGLAMTMALRGLAMRGRWGMSRA
jgi:hypothetical protein